MPKWKLSDDARKQLLALIRGGMHPDRACQAVGIAPGAIRRWRMEAGAGKKKQQALVDEIDTAEAQCEANDVMMTRRAATLETVDTLCPQCGDKISLSAFTLLGLGDRVTAAHNVKSQAASVALQRLTLRFPKRWSQRVVHTVEEEHNRLLDVAERVLAPEVFKALLTAYIAAESGRDETGADRGEPGSGAVH
jgi:hypothetical protein